MDVSHPPRYPSNGGHRSVHPDHGQWPPRARRLIEEVCALCASWLQKPLQQTLDGFDQSLYQHAERSRSHLDQQRYFDSRAILARQRAAFAQAFLDNLFEGFSRLGESPDEPAETDAHQPLTLLDRGEHELAAALDKLAARGESHNGPQLSELGYRLAVLVASPPLDGIAMPSGPQSLAQALRIASETMELPVEHQLLLLQNFEQVIVGALGSLYGALNTCLLNNGILPQLRAFPVPRPAADHNRLPPGAAAEASAMDHQAGPPAGGAATRSEPIAVLETLRDLLARQRLGQAGIAAPAGGHIATADELQIALSALQQHLIQVTDQASRELRSAQRLREELLLNLNVGKPPGAVRTQLSAEQDDTVELVAMLFEQLSQQLHHGPQARALLGDLELPMLRLAVTDRDFFDQREHPARRLLNTLAEAANDWLDAPEGEVDQQLIVKLARLVERARQEPPSAGLYTSLLADIEHHLAQLSRKAQASERRHVESMQGREKLEQARHRAAELMSERFAKTSPRGLLRTLLDRAWSDVLALTLLRHGEDSEAFRLRLRITDQLLGQLPIDDPMQLRHDVESGLQQIGMHAEEAEQVAQRLIGTGSTVDTREALLEAAAAHAEPPLQAAQETPPVAPTVAPAAPPPAVAAPAAEAPSATDLALRLKQRQRLGEQRHQEGHANASQAAVVPPLGPKEARIHNRLRQLPFGTWFEFTDPASGERTQRKLAWFSPLSGNSLFVTRRGQRSDEMNLQELARLMASGHVRELPPQRDGLLDRAWQALTASLLRPGQPSSSGGARA